MDNTSDVKKIIEDLKHKVFDKLKEDSFVLKLKSGDVDTNEYLLFLEDELQKAFNVNLLEIKKMLSLYVQNNSEELSLDLNNVMPYGDYSKIIEDNDGISHFLKNEACKIENWKIYSFSDSDVNENLIHITFDNIAIDEGESLKGHVFINKEGKVRHYFAESANLI